MKPSWQVDPRGVRNVPQARTPAGKASARKLMIALNQRRHLKPKCGAKAKSTGHPCQQLAMANGRCVYHGGATPKGDGWHKTRWPNPHAPDAEAKLQKKLRDCKRAAREKQERLAAMTPDERVRYAKWRKAHRPGSPGARAAARAERDNSAFLERIVKRPDPPQSPELVELNRLLDEARRRAVTLEIAACNEGIFG